MGSPPLVRERLYSDYENSMFFGITPARAGKTSSRARSPAAGEDHPRSCGKDSPGVAAEAFMAGSPPLVRERRVDALRVQVAFGITPARAGKTDIRC